VGLVQNWIPSERDVQELIQSKIDESRQNLKPLEAKNDNNNNKKKQQQQK